MAEKYTYTSTHTEDTMTLAEFFTQLHPDLAVFTNYDEKGLKDFVDTHQQVFGYLEALREKNIIREFDMERFRLITNPEALHCTSEETTKLLEELKNYLLDTLIDKVQRENEHC